MSKARDKEKEIWNLLPITQTRCGYNIPEISWEVKSLGAAIPSPPASSFQVGQGGRVLDGVREGGEPWGESSSSAHRVLLGLHPPLSPPPQRPGLCCSEILAQMSWQDTFPYLSPLWLFEARQHGVCSRAWSSR